MPDTRSVLLVLRPLHVVAETVSGLGLGAFLSQVLERMQAVESGGLISVRFESVAAAVEAWEALLNGTWKSFRGQGQGACPVQALLDLAPGPADGRDLPEDAPIWDCLEPGILHLTPALHSRSSAWGALRAGQEFTPVAGSAEVLRIEPSERLPPLVLLPGRSVLPGRSTQACFYCGSAGHRPAACQSKRLGPEIYVLPALAGDSLVDLDAACRAIAADPEKAEQALTDALRDGREPAVTMLRAFVALLDLDRVFQLRFLWYLAFAGGTEPPPGGALGPVRVAGGHPLRLGLDCLRVGRVEEARNRLLEPTGAGSGRSFHAEVGLAFAALELERPEEAAHYLGRAARGAGTPLEVAYAHLLLSRHHEVLGAHRMAGYHLKMADEAHGKWVEVLYRTLQLSPGPDPDTVNRVRWFASKGPAAFARLLLDPRLDRIRRATDAVLAALWESTRRQAAAQVGRARAECEALDQWLGPQGADLTFVSSSLGHLESGLARRSYAADLEVGASAERLQMSAHLLKKRGLSRLRGDWKRARDETKAIERVWRTYPYQKWFRDFGRTLEEVRRGLGEVQLLLEQETAAACRQGADLLRRIEPGLRRLSEALPDLVWVRSFLEGVRRFTKRLVAGEAFALVLGLGLPALALALTPQTSGVHEGLVRFTPGLGAWIAFLGVIVAPGWALAGTLRRAPSPKPPERPKARPLHSGDRRS